MQNSKLVPTDDVAHLHEKVHAPGMLTVALLTHYGRRESGTRMQQQNGLQQQGDHSARNRSQRRLQG